MKKIWLLGVPLFLFAFQAEAGVVQNCACAGKCATGSVCNCATNTCAARAASPYAYGYIDTRTPVYSQNYMASTYQPTTAYPAPYVYSGEPGKKYGSHSVRPYVAGRFLLSNVLADFKHTQSTGERNASYKSEIDDVTYGGALAFGVKVDNFRLEAEGAIHSNAESDYPSVTMIETQNKMDHEIQTMSLLFNAYYDFPVNSVVKPYIGAGLGIGRSKNKLKIYDKDPNSGAVSVDNFSKDKTNFIWQIGAGLSYEIQKGIDFDLGYRYTNYGKMDLFKYQGPGDNVSYLDERIKVKDYRTHTLSLGLRFDI